MRKGSLALSVSACVAVVYAARHNMEWRMPQMVKQFFPPDSNPPADTTKLPYPISKDNGKSGGGIDLKPPPAFERKAVLDSTLENYRITDQVGNETINEQSMPFDMYLQQQNHQWVQDYFKQRSQSSVTTKGGGILPELNFGNDWIENTLGNLVEVRPQGSAEVIFSQDFNRVKNPTWSLREQKNSQFKFDQKIQVGVQASIGDKVHMNINYDTEASFDFENQRKLKYEGKEDEIVQLLEVGDVSMPVSGSLITGSTSLFGFKTALRFGKLDVTSVFSQQKSERKEIILDAGAQRQNFDISADNYDFNRHFFLSQYFRENYDRWQQNYPALSNIVITRVEVWVTNTSVQQQNTHTVAAFMDLGEKNFYDKSGFIGPGTVTVPDNNSNTLFRTLTNDPAYRAEKSISEHLGFTSLTNAQDYYVLSNARQLRETDFTFDPRLGYISLNQTLNPDDVLAVAYEYTINGVKHKVGEFASDVPPNQQSPNVLFLKMLKSVNVRPNLPIWKLMMKNIYSLGAYQVDPTDFRLQVVYADDRSGADLNYIPEPSEPALNGKPLIRVLQLDRFNTQLERKPDGNFDYLEGVTIVSNNGRIIFPVLEPFGSDLHKQFTDQQKADYYTFQELYDSTKAAAQQLAQKNKFFLRGSYQGSAGAEISLNSINVQPGSVRVTANGIPLTEGTQYTVDYALGRVRITDNSVINSGAMIKVESESNTLFNIQQKTLMGTRAEYHVSKDFSLGSTILYLKERPLTNKVNVGDEPIRNAIWGVDGTYKTESRFLTRMVDKIPLIQTKEKSEIAVQGEFAQIIPGHPKSLNDRTNLADKGGVSYLDDFEGSQIPYDLRLGGNQVWTLASTPQGHPDLFPEASLVNNLAYGFKRAKLSWYTIDNSFFRSGPQTPAHWEADKQAQSNHYMREVTEQEVFPNREIPNGTIPTLQTLDLVYRPRERGPYNFTIDGLDADGNLKDPKSSWAGISRRIEINDFEASNIEYLEFWLMDPFIYDTSGKAGGDFYIDLGNISEDILRDNRKSWENGYPKSADVKGVDTTAWGRVPNGIQITNSFDNDPAARPYQDVGYDGLNDADERAFFASYLQKLPANLQAKFSNDPAADDFHYFLGDDYDAAHADVLARYHDYNNSQGNTPTSVTEKSGYGTQYPDDEDINKDFNIDKVEDYFEYHVRLDPAHMQKDQNYITDVQRVPKTLANGTTATVTWYQFKVPIRQFTTRVGSIPDFKSIRFMRMYLTGFDTNVVLRFAQLQFLRSDWRKYLGSLGEPGVGPPQDSLLGSTFEVSAVNIEENGKRPDIPYVLPPGIKREQDPSTPQLIQQNEQALSIKVCDLAKNDAKAVFKNTQYDTRQYKHLKMFVHAENSGTELPDGAVSVFVRVGTDFVNNYYEYEMPVVITKHGSYQPTDVWPQANMMDVALEDFYNAKTHRNAAGFSLLVPYKEGRVTVIGNPDLSNIRTLMIGVRNTSGNNYVPGTCVEVWVNELRVTDFDERGGWAATGRMTAKLADFGRVELSGTRRTIGFGSIEQTLQQRSQQDMRSYGVITALELGKFFPQRFNVRIPMYFAYSEQINRPRYNPLSPDLELSTLTDAYKEDRTKYDSVLRAAEDFTARKSLNFTGVQKLRNPESKRKPRLYDIENFTATYIYQEVYRRNISATYDFEKLYTGRLGYQYTFTPKPWTPFSKIKNKNLKLISDFNLFFLPQTYSMQGEINRKYGEKLYRNTDNIQTIIDPLFDKNFTLDRTYDLRYNLTKSLRLSYSAKGQSRIQEPYGRLDTKEKRDTVKNNLLDLGTLTGFSQSAMLSYDVPINKLPFLDFVKLQTAYTGNYDWRAAPPAVSNLGNTVQNSQVINVNGDLSMTTLYGRSKFLRNITQGQTNKGSSTSKKPADATKSGETPSNDEEEKPANKHLTVGENLVGVLLSLRKVSLNYTLNNSTALPGFQPEPQYFGQDFRTNAPGIPFIFGSQRDIRLDAARNGWLTHDTNQVARYIQSRRENIVGSAMLEPIRNFQITLDFNRQTISSFTENWRYNPNSGIFEHYSPVESGSFTISYLPWKTSFVREGPKHTSSVFDNFEADRLAVSQRLSERDPLSGGQIDTATDYYLGYDKYHQDVLIPAFLAAYTGRSSREVSLSPFPRIPAPGWRISYNGLSNIKAIQAFAKSVSISHGYRSTYSVDNYNSNIDYNTVPAESGKELPSQYRIERIAIQERFDPLFGIDVTWANNLQTRFEMRRDRTLALSFSDRRLAEQKGSELVFGAGYRTNNFILPFVKVKRKKVVLENDLNFRLDFAIRDQEQLIRILDTDEPEVTGGQRMISFTPNISYVLTQSLTLNIFVKYTKTNPYTSNLYPTSFTSVGFSLRYVLSP